MNRRTIERKRRNREAWAGMRDEEMATRMALNWIKRRVCPGWEPGEAMKAEAWDFVTLMMNDKNPLISLKACEVAARLMGVGVYENLRRWPPGVRARRPARPKPRPEQTLQVVFEFFPEMLK